MGAFRGQGLSAPTENEPSRGDPLSHPGAAPQWRPAWVPSGGSSLAEKIRFFWESLQSRGRETRVSVSVTSRYHFIVVDEPGSEKPEPDAQTARLLPQPSPLFWRQAWIKFQRALDPLALPKPLPQLPGHKDRTSEG